jgi:nitrate reductase NapE component
MRYFEKLVQISFKTSPNGEILYGKYGVIGKPYILPNNEKRTEIETFLLKYYKIFTPLTLVAAIGFGYIGLLVALFATIYYEISIRKMLKGLPKNSNRIKLNETGNQVAKLYSKSFLWFCFFGSLLFVMAGIFIIANGKDDYKIWLAMGLFSISTIFYGRLILSQKNASGK